MRLQLPCKSARQAHFVRAIAAVLPKKTIFAHKLYAYVPHRVNPGPGPLRRLLRRTPFTAAADGLRAAVSRIPPGDRAGAPLARRAARLPALALLGPLRFRRYPVRPRGRYRTDGRGLCPVGGPDLRPPGRRRADGFAHAPCLRLAPDARLLHDARPTGDPRPQFPAAQRRILYPCDAGRAGEPLLRRIRTHRAGLRPRYGVAEPPRAACQRFPLYARLRRHGYALRREGRIYAAVHQQPRLWDVQAAARADLRLAHAFGDD